MIDQANLKLTVHPYALKFPPLSEKERATLKADIAQNGQLYPIVINRQDQVLEGRHRYEICRELGLEPKTIQLAHVLGDNFNDVSEIEFIFSSNFHRRHLTDEQRVALATEFLPELRQQAKANMLANLQKGPAVNAMKSSVSQNERPKKRRTKAGGIIDDLAAIANVGVSKANRAIKVADRDPELLAQVARGEKKLGEAHHEVVEPKQVKVRRVDGGSVGALLDKFLSRIEPAQHREVLRLIADDCYARLEKLEGGGK